jgi:hypothetical protein
LELVEALVAVEAIKLGQPAPDMTRTAMRGPVEQGAGAQ